MTPTLQSLLTVQEKPYNAETPLPALRTEITPASLFYVRCNFAIPVLDAGSWTVLIGGRVNEPQSLTLQELQGFPTHEVTATMECAGNGRRLMSPVPQGTPWTLGAVSTGRFTGVRLRDVLDACGVAADTSEIVFEGADAGRVADGSIVRFARSLPLARALHPDTLLAWALNDAPLTPEHGYPLRLFVPDWYGMASVKWLTRIAAVAEPFTGHFQTESYVYNGHPAYPSGTPVTLMQVRALCTAPASGDVVPAGSPVTLTGIAWSGFAPVARVDFSADGGVTWRAAALAGAASPYAACSWRAEWLPASAGEHELIVRAADATGAVQPLEPVWNELGYGNNVAQRVRVVVR